MADDSLTDEVRRRRLAVQAGDCGRGSMEIIEIGTTAEIFACGEDQVTKLFYEWVPEERVRLEFEIQRKVCAAAVAAPRVVELIAIGARRGIVMERIVGESVLRYVARRPWRMFAELRRLADAQMSLHRVRDLHTLPRQRSWIAASIERSNSLAPARKQAALERLDQLPDGVALCHGDFHPGNVILTSRGAQVIDWATATCGDPIGDVACTSRLIRGARLPVSAPGYLHALLSLSRPLLDRTYLRRCLGMDANAWRKLEQWRIPVAAAATAWKPASPA